MQLYGCLISPFVRNVALAAAEKGLSYELVMTNPWKPTPEFAAISPFGKIPALVDGDYTLCDSSAIVAYLDALYPQVPLLPAEPKARGKAVWFDEFADTIFAGAGLKILFNRFVGPKLLKIEGNEAVAQEGEAELPRIFDYLESVTPETGWLLGEQITLADLSVASMLRPLAYVGFAPDAAARPRTAGWFGRINARPAWQKVAELEARR